MGLLDSLRHGWNAFVGRNPTKLSKENYGTGYSQRPDLFRIRRFADKSIVTSVYNRIAMDVAKLSIMHVRLDEEERYLRTIKSGLNECLSISANIDQTGRAMIQDAVYSLCDEGVIAIVPVDTTKEPINNNAYDILSMRVGKVVQWYPKHVRVRLYNEERGVFEEIVMPKNTVALPENPLYATMNSPNSTGQRLIRKLALLDYVDESTSAGKLDLIIQLPYVIKSEARRIQAEQRRKEIEMQLSGSRYGIAYTDGTEKITQLNRSLENNLLSQIQYLTSMLYSQLGMPESVFNGTADEATMLNYYDRTIEPIASALVDEMKRKWLSRTARTQGQSIIFIKDPFRLVPVSQIAEIADKFTRNEILTGNEVRQIIGRKPSNDPNADELRNKNLNQSTEVIKEHESSELEDLTNL